MNSERRHELQENELAAYLGRINRAIEPYSKLIAVVIGAVVLGVIGLALYQSKSSGDRSDATLALIQASASQDPSELSQIASTYPNTAAAAWAKLYEGNALLTEAMQSLFVSRTAAEESILQANASFLAASSMTDDRVVQSRSHFGLARAAEALGEIETAISEYEKTAEANESKSMVMLAQKRIESLQSPDTKEFVAWFSEQDFSPADPSLPPSLPSSSTLSDVPDVSLPPLDAGLAAEDGTETKELDDSGLEMPADDTATNEAKEPPKTETSESVDDQPATAKAEKDKPTPKKSTSSKDAPDAKDADTASAEE